MRQRKRGQLLFQSQKVLSGARPEGRQSLWRRGPILDRSGQENGTGYFTGVKCLCQESLSERDRKGDRPFEEEGLSPGKSKGSGKIKGVGSLFLIFKKKSKRWMGTQGADLLRCGKEQRDRESFLDSG